MRRAAGDDGDARKMRLVLGFGNGEAFDIIAPAGKQADDTRQHARLVVNQQIGRATSELQSLMRISYAVFCLKKKKNYTQHPTAHATQTTTNKTNSHTHS